MTDTLSSLRLVVLSQFTLFHVMFSFFKIRHYEKFLQFVAQAFSKNIDTLSSQQIESIRNTASSLKSAIKNKDFRACQKAKNDLNNQYNNYLKPSSIKRSISFILFFVGALFFALVIRQTIFELYEIPSGSMRPSFLEKDRLLVSKTSFGLNIPFYTDHFWTENSQIQRGLPVVWTGDHVPLPDVDTTFLGLPHKKRFIKRIVGLPGDTIYFAYGTVLGYDKFQKPISFEGTPLEKLPILPFIRFEGNTNLATINTPQITFSHFGKPLAVISASPNLPQNSQIRTSWEDNEKLLFKQEDYFSNNPTYWGQLAGLSNYAIAHLKLNNDQTISLNLHHHPSLKPPLSLFKTPSGITAQMSPHLSSILLEQNHIDNIKKVLTTSRFNIYNEKAYKWGIPKEAQVGINLPSCPDGTYEFIDGQAFQIGVGGTRSLLKNDHPLYPNTYEKLISLFNSGVNWQPLDYSTPTQYKIYSGRLAYFNKSQDLSLFHHPIIFADEAIMKQFIRLEKEKNAAGSQPAFLPPVKDNFNPIKKDFIHRWGLKVPEGHLLVLGDHSANSLDSRYFGFLPIKNIRGTPSFIFWPPSRAQFFNLKPTMWSWSTITIWSILIPMLWAIWRWRKSIKENNMALLLGG